MTLHNNSEDRLMIPRLCILAATLVAVSLASISDAAAQSLLDDTWTVSVNGQSVQVNADGSFRLTNVPSPDEFGAGGQGTPPDFIGDDFVRVTGTSTAEGKTRWLFSEPFRIEDGSSFTVQQLIITETPPPLPAALAVEVITPTLTTLGQQTSIITMAELADGSFIDVTPQSAWTTYTSSNPLIASVDVNGGVTAGATGIAYLTAENDGATAVTKVVVSLGDPLTTVEGRVIDIDGSAVFEALAASSSGTTAMTDVNGRFVIDGVPALLGPVSVFVTADIGSGASGSFEAVPGAITDVGDVVLLPTSEGSDFVVCFPRNYEATSNCSLLIGSEFSTTGEVTMPGLAIDIPFSVQPGLVTTISLPSNVQVLTAGEVTQRGIGISAEAPITVYGLNRLTFSTDAFTAFPTVVAGTRYRVLSHASSVNGPSQLAVVGISDDTEVTIVPSSGGPFGEQGEALTVTLDALETYLLTGDDLTGSLVTSSSPIAVFGGHECGNVPADFGFCDHLVEQLPPISYWGIEHLTVSLAGRAGGDTFRIVTDTPNTVITVAGSKPATFSLDPGTFSDLILDGVNQITSSAPVLICQYAHGTSYDGNAGDPFMGLVAPVERFRTAYTFTSPPSGFVAHYVNIVLRAEDLTDVLLDGQALAPLTVEPIGTSGFVGVQVVVQPGCHNLTAPTPVGLYAYGFNAADSYGYAGGL